MLFYASGIGKFYRVLVPYSFEFDIFVFAFGVNCFAVDFNFVFFHPLRNTQFYRKFLSAAAYLYLRFVFSVNVGVAVEFYRRPVIFRFKRKRIVQIDRKTAVIGGNRRKIRNRDSRAADTRATAVRPAVLHNHKAADLFTSSVIDERTVTVERIRLVLHLITTVLDPYVAVRSLHRLLGIVYRAVHSVICRPFDIIHILRTARKQIQF